MIKLARIERISDMIGTLYIVATPIGNMGDITFRAVDVLRKVRFVACEDTRRTGNLLSQLCRNTSGESKSLLQHPRGVAKSFTSFFEENEAEKTKYIISLLEAGNDVALVSDGGTPLISDPGYKLVRECRNLGIKVESIPGPSALITALTLSGLPTDKFIFLGFSPKSRGKRRGFFGQLKSFKNFTIVFYESPHRIVDSLEDLKTVLGDIEIVIAREMTKIYEEVLSGNILKILEYFKKNKPLGEFTVVFKL